MKWSPSFFRRPDGTYYETAIFLVEGAWEYSSAYVNDANGRQVRVRSVEPRMQYDTRTRFVAGGELHLMMESGEERVIEVEALGESGFFLKTAGYGAWEGHKHGSWMGRLHLDGEHIADCATTSTWPGSVNSATPRSASARATPSGTGSWRASSAVTGPSSGSPRNPTTRSPTHDRHARQADGLARYPAARATTCGSRGSTASSSGTPPR